MSTKYYLQDYTLTVEPDDFIAVVVDRGTTSLEDLAQEMLRQGSHFTQEEIQTLFAEIQRAARFLLDQGFSVTVPLAVLSPVIRGIFYGVEDRYDPGRHEALLIAIPDRRFEEEWQATASFTRIADSS